MNLFRRFRRQQPEHTRTLIGLCLFCDKDAKHDIKMGSATIPACSAHVDDALDHFIEMMYRRENKK